MKIIWEVEGRYERLNEGNQQTQKTSLTSFVNDFHAIATHQKHHYLPAVHQSFGLDFLPVNAVMHLMQQASGRSPLLTDQMLRPHLQSPDELALRNFRYRFVTTKLPQNFAINLQFDDPQLPQDLGDLCQGTYQIELRNSSNPILQAIQTEAKNNLVEFVKHHQLQVINHALRSQNFELFPIPLRSNCTAWIKPTELDQTLQKTIRILRNKIALTDQESQPIQDLVNAYRVKYPQPLIVDDHLPDLAAAKLQPQVEIIIGQGNHRQILQNLIANAQKFLLICSYRLEDREILQMIAQKSQQIPVWILTDFSQEVQNRVDRNMQGQIEVNPDFAQSDLKKQDCLRMLSKASIGFRSGNFHLKTYMSEQSAYLGSCNLTGGSLGRNGEAGILWKNTSEHQFMINYFRYLWQHETLAQAMPSPIGFQNESLEKKIGSPPKSDRILDHQAFKKDLSDSLRQFTREEIRIYTRNFQPLPSQINLLNNPRHRIFYGNHNATNLRATKFPNLHAKIIIIGSQIAYIGSQDLAFSHQPLLDLTYKTTNSQEIESIKQQLQSLH